MPLAIPAGALWNDSVLEDGANEDVHNDRCCQGVGQHQHEDEFEASVAHVRSGVVPNSPSALPPQCHKTNTRHPGRACRDRGDDGEMATT